MLEEHFALFGVIMLLPILINIILFNMLASCENTAFILADFYLSVLLGGLIILIRRNIFANTILLA